MSNYPRVPTENAVQYTLDAQLAQGGGTITLNQSVAGIVQAPGRCVIDRVDSAGNRTPTKREYKYFTGVSGATLTGVTNDDGTDQVHAVGAIVEFVPTVGDEEDKHTVFVAEHNEDGTHKAATVTTLKATGAEVTTGTEDAKIVTPKAIKDAGGLPVKATGAEITTGTDDAKFATPKALRDAGIASALVKARAYANTNNTGVVSATPTQVALNTENYDIGSNFNTGTYTFTAPVNGYYLITACIGMQNIGDGKIIELSVYSGGTGGTKLMQRRAMSSAASSFLTAAGSDIVYLAANAAITLYCYHNNGDNQVLVGANEYSFMSIHLLSV